MRAAIATQHTTKLRNSAGYVRNNGRWEGRYRPKTRVEVTTDDPILRNGFRGFKNGVYKYEFLDYFDTVEEKDEWLREKRLHFNEQVALSKSAAQMAPGKVKKRKIPGASSACPDECCPRALFSLF